MKNSEIVYATAIIKTNSSENILTNLNLTSLEIPKVFPSVTTKKKAIVVLQKIGFTITEENELMLSISGSKALFEKTFKTVLETVKQQEVIYYNAKIKTIPKQLQNLIVDIVFAEPMELF
jgi:subtilase family serine protease